jgi:D-psicose/D-tagatose/L-ribulose 3-epimerase
LLVLGGSIHPDKDGRALQLIRDAGFDGVEVPVFSGSVPDYATLASALDALGLARTAAVIVPDVARSPVNPDPVARARARDHIRWAVDCAHALGATVIAGPFHSPLGVFTGNGPTETELAHLAEYLHEGAGYAQRAGILLALEPLNRFECYMVNTMEQGAALHKRVAHPNFTILYDTFHANIEEREMVASFEAHKAGIGHIHISENDRGIPGRGHIPFRPIFEAIRRSGFNDWLVVEAFGRAVPELAAATRVWRDLFPDLPTLVNESVRFIREEWVRAG